MCRKIGFGAVAIVAGLLLLSWAGLGSYVTTAVGNIRTHLKKQVPLEFEIDRVRNQVADLVPEMKKNCKVIAEETVAVGNLKEDIALTRKNLQDQKGMIGQMTKDLDSGVELITYDNRQYSRERISQKLARDFESYKRCEAEIKSKEKLLEAKERTLDAAREQLASMRSQKQDLEIQIAQLEADVKTVRLAESKSKFQFDDSKLAQCKATLADIRNRLDVEVKTEELEGQFANDAIPVDKKAKSPGELTKEVKDYLNNPSTDEGKLAADR